MNSKNSQTFKPHILMLKFTDKLDLRRGENRIALSNFSIYYTWKNIKSSYNNNKLKISAPTWNDKFELLTNTGAGDDERNKCVIFKNCASFTKYISRINGTEIDNAQDIDIVMPMYNLIEYRDNYSKTSGSLWQYYKDKPNDNLANSESFKSKVKIAGNTPTDGNTKDVEIIIPLKYLSNFWRTLEMPLIYCEVNLILTWPSTFVISSATGETKFKITDTKLYVNLS